MRNRIPFVLIALFAWARHGERADSAPGKAGAATQLIVDGKPGWRWRRNGQHRPLPTFGIMETACRRSSRRTSTPSGGMGGTGWSPWKASTTSASSMDCSTAPGNMTCGLHIPVVRQLKERPLKLHAGMGESRPAAVPARPPPRAASPWKCSRPSHPASTPTPALYPFMHHLKEGRRRPGARCS